MRFCPCLLHFSSDLDKIWYKISTKNLLHDLEFCKNLQSESSIQLMAEMYFYLYSPYLLSELGEILFRGCALMVLNICELHENQPQV
jgi:hypothetical protein